jgi:hypothetical protein
VANVTCIKCNKKGSLMVKQTKSKGYSYTYWYVEHWDGSKRSWCYIGKSEDLPKEYEEALMLEIAKEQNSDTQTDTQNTHKLNKPELSSISQNKCGYSLVWSRTSACHAGDPGSNPGGRTTNPLRLSILLTMMRLRAYLQHSCISFVLLGFQSTTKAITQS